MKYFMAILELDHVDDNGAVYGVLNHEGITDIQKRPWPSQITVPIHLHEQYGKEEKISVFFAFGDHPDLIQGKQFPGPDNVILEAVQ